MECLTHSPFLFITVAGETMRFNVQRCAEKEKLQSLIEHGGGVIRKTRFYDPHIIRLIDAGSYKKLHVRDKEQILYPQYIFDCVDQNRLLDMTSYSLSSDFNSVGYMCIEGDGDALRNVETEGSVDMGKSEVNHHDVEKGSTSRGKRNCPTSTITNHRIINYTCDNANRVKRMCKFEFYKELLKNKIIHSSYSAFRLRVYNILNNPKPFKLTTERENLVRDTLLSMRRLRKFRFSKKEEIKMIKFVIKNKLHERVEKREIYEEMEKKELLIRDAESMHNHFVENVLKKLDTYNLPDHDVALLTRTNRNSSVKKVSSSKREGCDDEFENRENGYSNSDFNKNRFGSTKKNLKKRARDMSNTDDRGNDFASDITTEDSSDESDDEHTTTQTVSRRMYRKKPVIIENMRIVNYILENADRLWGIYKPDFYKELAKNEIMSGSKDNTFKHRIRCIYEDIAVYKLTTEEERLVLDILLKMKTPKPFKRVQDNRMINYVIENKLYKRTQEKVIYEEMEDKKLVKQDAISMYKRFTKVILPNLDRYDLKRRHVDLLRSGIPNSSKVDRVCSNGESENEKTKGSVSYKHQNSVENKRKASKQNRKIVQTDSTHGTSNETSNVLQTTACTSDIANKVTVERTKKISEYFTIAKKNSENELDVDSESEMIAKDDKGQGEDVKLLTRRSHQSRGIEALHHKDKIGSERSSEDSENEWSLSDLSEDTSTTNRKRVKLNYSFRPRSSKQITEKCKYDDEDSSSNIDFSSDDSSDTHKTKKPSPVSPIEKRMDSRRGNKSSCNSSAKHQTSNKTKSCKKPEAKTKDSGQDTMGNSMSEDKELPDREFDVESNVADEFSMDTNEQILNKVTNDAMPNEVANDMHNEKNIVENEDNLQDMVIDQDNSSAKQYHLIECISILKDIEVDVVRMDHGRQKNQLQNNINELYFEFYQQRFKDNIRSIVKKEKLTITDKAVLMKYIAYTKGKKPDDFVHYFGS